MAEQDRDDLISIIEENGESEKLPDIMPLLPVRDVVVFTDMLLPLYISRSKSIRAVEEAMGKDGFILLSAQKDPAVDNPGPDDMYDIGTAARLIRMLKLPDGQLKALVQGVMRAKINRFTRKRSFYRVKVDPMPDLPPLKPPTLETRALMRNIRENTQRMMSLQGEMSGDIKSVLDSIDDPGKLADLVASNLKLKIGEAQSVLELPDCVKRLHKVNEYLTREVELSTMQAKIQADVRDEISKLQRDHFLREQVRAIHRELGDSDERMEEIKDYEKKIHRARMPKTTRKEAEKQLKRLGQMHPESAESGVVRTYLDWLVELPWSKASKGDINIAAAKQILDKEHFGLFKVKDRILEHLSVRKLNPKMNGPILCFVGPPGVGKTSLGQAIAKAMKRKFVRISLGGIRDEAEIRGHRRTYIGALPGRILQGIKQCGTNNPVFMMDEIDKLGADFRGDPSAALLEALDPEQNGTFSDHYLNLSFDLSKVMFILTANYTDTIPSALLDRMEVISLSGYTQQEKRTIALRHLLPRQKRQNGLSPRMMTISDGALLQIIDEYTSEAGLRNLERKLGSLCRKTARKIAEKEKGPFQITRRNLIRYLGLPKYYPEMDQEENQVGLATGLAWTQAGGEVLYVESALIPGKGDLIVTGQIGDVMQESARAAVSYTRANLKRLKIRGKSLDNADIHIHVPAGAIPKDGPSAGTAMAISLISVLTRRAVRTDVAMTGEISLRGRVLPVGGLKEKSLGALRAGIGTVLIPGKNRRELSELPVNVRRKINFVPVKNMEEILALALEKEDKSPRARKESKTGKPVR